MSVFARVKDAVMRRNSYYIATIFAGAFAAEIVMDSGINALWDWNNRGTRLLTLPVLVLGMVSGLVIAFTVLVAGIIAALLLRTQRISTGDTTVICGPAGSGKTQLFLKLVGGQVVSTVDSAACNFGSTSHGRKVIDVPGSAKLRGTLFDEALPTAKCVILLLNGAKLETLHNDIGFIVHVVAQCMNRKCPILLLVGKDDLAGEMALAKVTSSLDNELQRLAKQYSESESEADPNNDNADPIRTDILSILKKLELEEDPILLSVAAIASRFNLHSLTHNKSNPIDQIVHWMDNKV